MCLGTQETGIQGYLRAENPHPAFFLGNSPTVESFSNWRPVFCTRDGYVDIMMMMMMIIIMIIMIIINIFKSHSKGGVQDF